MARQIKHDNLFSFRMANLSVLFYTAPAAIILAAIVILGVPDKYWTPILVIYGIGVFSHINSFGFQALVDQMADAAKYVVDGLKEQR